MRPLHLRYRHRHHPARRAVFGLGVIGIGLLALLDNLRIFDIRLLHTFWPLALVLLGAAKLIWPRHPGSWVFGTALIVIGGALTARHLGFIDLDVRDWWPVLVIGAGLSIVMRGLFPHDRRLAVEGFEGTSADHGEQVNIDASFSAISQQNDSRSFKGGRIDVSFGGVELDLRQALMAGPEAILEISARFSGVQLRVPREWQVVVNIAPTLGGVEDKTVPPMNPEHRLVLRGEALFGGVEIKN